MEPDEDARRCCRISTGIALVEVAFPAFRDGRGYSAARILREAGYTGELRAQGDVLVDQIAHMRRCGFDSLRAGSAAGSRGGRSGPSARFPARYQKAADAVVP